MGYYMLKNQLRGGQPVSIEQNGEKELLKIVKLKAVDGKILFGGNAVVKIERDYYL